VPPDTIVATAMKEKLSKSSSVPGWIPVFGAITGGIVLLFFMSLVIIEIMGYHIPPQARFLVVCVLAIGMAFAFAAIGGSAVASGILPLPSGLDSPIKFALGGGIATFAVVLIMGYLLYARGPLTYEEFLEQTKIEQQKALTRKDLSSREEKELRAGLEQITKLEKELSYGKVTFASEKAPPWLSIAKKEIGVTRFHGLENNLRIIEYLRTTRLPQPLSDKIDWSSAFVNWCLRKNGIKGTNSALNRSWLEWGDKLDQPRIGAIVVLTFDSPHIHSHVGFYIGESANNILLLGGNQSNMVSVKPFSKDKVLGYRWPTGVK
jgi:uncharacterized protein (TIGR02594 family)